MSRYASVFRNIKKTVFSNQYMVQSKVDSEKFPVEYFFWEVNDYCNSKCKSCDIWKRKPNNEYFKPTDIEDIFKKGFFKSVKEVIVSGGEPFLHKELIKCINIMSKYVDKDCVFSLSTNALMPERVIDGARSLIETNIKFIVGISLDGIGEKHDIARGVDGNFEKVNFLVDQLKIIREDYRARGKDFGITLGSTLSTDHLDWLDPVEKYAAEKEVHFLPQMYEEFSYYGEYADNDRFGSPINIKSKIHDEYQEIKFLKNSFKSKVLDELKSHQPTFQKKLMIDGLQNKRLSYRCASMRKFFLLHHNGDVSPCLKFAHIRPLNVTDPNFIEKWNNASEVRCQVDSCAGCSNTWATGWSMRHSFFSFLPFLISLTKDKTKYWINKKL